VTVETAKTTRKKLPLKERYARLTRDLDWEPSYVPPEELYPYTRYEGIKIHDWNGWQDLVPAHR
jgi:phenol/toluene 2-monooxygenase (NADH) P3/A3